MSNLISLLVLGYLPGIKTQKNIACMAWVSFISIAIGTFSLALVISIMRGFETATHNAMKCIHPQIIMRSAGHALRAAPIMRIIKKEFPAVAYATPISINHLIVHNDASGTVQGVAIIKGFDPLTYASTLLATMTGTPEWHKGQIAIGHTLAHNLNKKQGDRITVLYSHDANNATIHLTSKQLIVGAIFVTGIEEFDNGLILAPLNLMQELFPDLEINHIEIQLQPAADEEAIMAKLKDRFHLDVLSWKDLNPAVWASLKLEKYAMALILVLIILVACLNIIAFMFMQIVQKRGDIAILKAMGIAHQDIEKIFIRLGLAIAASSCTLGLVMAWLTALLLKKYPCIELPDIYYVRYLPIECDAVTFAVIFITVIALASIACWIAVRTIRTIAISSVLRCDA